MFRQQDVVHVVRVVSFLRSSMVRGPGTIDYKLDGKKISSFPGH